MIAERADIDVTVTQADLNGLLQDNPTVSLQLQVRALTRKCQELADRVDELTSENQSLRGGKNADGKKGR
jgi:cell division protein FtsB